MAALILDETVDKEIDRLPLNMVKEKKDTYRCCRFRDQAILKYRLMTALGFAVEEETDELTPLKEYARQASLRSEAPEGVLTVISEACSACPGARYYVSEICRGCVARPCEGSCPKGAVSIQNGRSVIDEEKCVHCGKCAKVCPYGAILRVPVPCEESCPVKAIAKDEAGRETIDFSKCISCGKCMTACPFGAITEQSHLADVLFRIKRGASLAALYAPAIAGQLPGSLGQINAGLRRAGFSLVREVASGADETILEEGRELAERLEQGEPFMTTSCCPAYVEAVRKHLPSLAPRVSATPSPMEMTARRVRREFPEMLTVFIGPCTAKKAEASRSEAVDYVLTFEELGALLVASGVDIDEMPEEKSDLESSREGRGFPVTQGVSAAVLQTMDKSESVRPFCINGLNKKTINLLRACAAGKSPGNFLEVMACENGCIGGPGTISPAALSRKKAEEFAADALPLNDLAALPSGR